MADRTVDLDQHPPRQLGSLHDRAAYVKSLLPPGCAEHQDFWHALWDLFTIVEHLPDAAFSKRTDRIVSPENRYAKRGILKKKEGK